MKVSFEVHPAHAPALRSVIEEMSNMVGTRMEAKAEYHVEDAWVRASIALGKLRAAVNAVVPKGDADFRVGRAK